MQSRGGGGGQGGCPRGGWSAAAPAPACAAGPGTIELDLVPCSGYGGALSAGAASVKQLASKNTLGLGSGRHPGVSVFTPPSPFWDSWCPRGGADLLWDGMGSSRIFK